MHFEYILTLITPSSKSVVFWQFSTTLTTGHRYRAVLLIYRQRKDRFIMSTMNVTLSSNDSIVSANSSTMSAGRPLLSPQAYKLMVNAFFSFIIITGVVGNGLVIATILRWKEMRTPCNIFLLNIAIGDLLVTGIGGTLRIIEVDLGWIFGEFLCIFLAPMQDVFVGVSGISHSTIAWERYRATVTPFKPRISKSKAKCLLPVIWLFSYISCGLPLVFSIKLREFKGRENCITHWSILHRRIFEVFLVVVFIVFQLALQTFAYSSIIRTLRAKEDLFRDSANNTNESKRIISANNTRQKRKSKTIKILIVLVVLFQLGYIPRGAVMLISEFAKNLSPDYRYVQLISMILYYLKHVINPVILFLMSDEFKKALKDLLFCRYKKQPVSKNIERIELHTTNALIMRKSEETMDKV